MSIITFSLTAGFSSSDNTEQCTANGEDGSNYTVTIRLEFEYSFHREHFEIIYPADTSNASSNGTSEEISCNSGFDKNYNGGAEFFVAMGILSMLYCLFSLPVYMVFINDQWSYGKIIANFVSSNTLSMSSMHITFRISYYQPYSR